MSFNGQFENEDSTFIIQATKEGDVRRVDRILETTKWGVAYIYELGRAADAAVSEGYLSIAKELRHRERTLINQLMERTIFLEERLGNSKKSKPQSPDSAKKLLSAVENIKPTAILKLLKNGFHEIEDIQTLWSAIDEAFHRGYPSLAGLIRGRERQLIVKLIEKNNCLEKQYQSTQQQNSRYSVGTVPKREIDR